MTELELLEFDLGFKTRIVESLISSIKYLEDRYDLSEKEAIELIKKLLKEVSNDIE